MSSELESRFLQFLAKLQNAESLDDLLSGPQFNGQRRADYLLFNRRVILELKSLEVDPSHKVETEIAKHRERDDFPLMYGMVNLQSMLKHLPDGKEINAKIFYKTTRSIEDAVRSAEEQIESTAKLLKLPNAAGLLVLLNQNLNVFTPEVVAHRVATLIRRKNQDGTPRSPIAFAWLILESHELTKGPAEHNIPMLAIEGPQSREMPWFKDLLTYLEVAWSQFNGIPLFHQSNPSIDTLNAQERSDKKQPAQKEKITRQDVWEARYKSHPYLRRQTDAEVLAFGRNASEQLGNWLMSGNSQSSKEKTVELLIPWSDFLCEARFRGLDLRSMRDA
jgi:hypothetical protein